MARIKESFINNRIKTLSVSEFIQRSTSIELKKSGTHSFSCCCPFHEEDTPSFSIDETKNTYHCFGGGCDASGGVVNFVMDYEKLDFKEAVEHLASEFNLEVEYENSDYVDVQSFSKDAITTYLQRAQEELKNNNGMMDYLKSRNINEESIVKYRLGSSLDLDTVRSLTDSNGKKITALLLKTDFIGLADSKKDKEKKYYYAKFRDYKDGVDYPRLLFPVANSFGESVGVGARTLVDAKGKYLNTKATQLFDKSSILYGYDLARKSIRDAKRILITEGYLDVISMSQHGFENSTCVMGTSLTQTHLDMIAKDFGENIEVVMLLDGDKAGIKAGVRASKLLVANGMLGSVVKLNDGLDPADYLNTYSAKEMQNLIENAEPLLRFIAREEHEDVKHLNENQRTIAMNRLINELLSLKKDLPISNSVVAKIFKLDPTLLKSFEEEKKNTDKILNSIAYSFVYKQEEEIRELFKDWSNSPHPEALQTFNDFMHKVDNYKVIVSSKEESRRVANSKITQNISVDGYKERCDNLSVTVDKEKSIVQSEPIQSIDRVSQSIAP